MGKENKTVRVMAPKQSSLVETGLFKSARSSHRRNERSSSIPAVPSKKVPTGLRLHSHSTSDLHQRVVDDNPKPTAESVKGKDLTEIQTLLTNYYRDLFVVGTAHKISTIMIKCEAENLLEQSKRLQDLEQEQPTDSIIPSVTSSDSRASSKPITISNMARR